MNIPPSLQADLIRMSARAAATIVALTIIIGAVVAERMIVVFFLDRYVSGAMAFVISVVILLFVLRIMWSVYVRPTVAYRQWLEGKPERKVIVLLAAALIAVSCVAAHLALRQQPGEWDVIDVTPINGLTDEQVGLTDGHVGRPGNR